MGLDMYLYAERKIAREDPLYEKVAAAMTNPDRKPAFGDAESGYVSGWGHDEVADSAFTALCDLFETKPHPGSPHFQVDAEEDGYVVQVAAGYWRKANQVHTWFVREVQGGVDECEPNPVTREKLDELRTVCRAVLGSTELVPGTVFNGEIYDATHPQGRAVMQEGKIVHDPRIAHQLLPTNSGFFFGSTDYDEWYWQDVEDTVAIIDAVLAMPEEWSFIYLSSW